MIRITETKDPSIMIMRNELINIPNEESSMIIKGLKEEQIMITSLSIIKMETIIEMIGPIQRATIIENPTTIIITRIETTTKNLHILTNLISKTLLIDLIDQKGIKKIQVHGTDQMQIGMKADIKIKGAIMKKSGTTRVMKVEGILDNMTMRNLESLIRNIIKEMIFIKTNK